MTTHPAKPLSRRILAVGALLIVAAFAVAQLIPYRVTNPPLRQEPTWTSRSARALVVTACFDCHSNQTRSHWYTNVAPISWWTTSHVKDGRATLNFSDWKSHHGQGDIAEPVVNATMPPGYYTWLGLHPDSKLSPADRERLVAELRAVEAQVGPIPNQGRIGDQN